MSREDIRSKEDGFNRPILLYQTLRIENQQKSGILFKKEGWQLHLGILESHSNDRKEKDERQIGGILSKI